MTLPSRNSRRVVTNTGSVATIDVDFPADQAQYVKVYAGLPGVYEMVLGVDYTLDGVAAGGEDFTVNITDPGGWDEYDLFAVAVDYVVEQPSDVDVGGPFGLRFENALDRLALIMQSLEDKVNRAVKMPVTGPVGPGNELVPFPDELIGWNADGTALETKPQISQSVQLAIDKAAEAAASALEAAGIVDEFEINVAGYTIAFNANAVAKTDAFDANAVAKTAAFDANYDAKIPVMEELLEDTEAAALAAETVLANAVLKTGSTMTGTLVVPASTTDIAPLVIPDGVAPSAPTDGQLWRRDAGGGLFLRKGANTVKIIDAQQTFKSAKAHLTDTKAQNVAPQSLTNGSWVKRQINTENYDPDAIVSVASDEFTLAAGSDYAVSVSSAYSVSGSGASNTALRIYDVTSAAPVQTKAGASNANANGIAGMLVMDAVLVGGRTYRVEHWTNGTATAGVTQNLAGMSEVYLNIVIERLTNVFA